MTVRRPWLAPLAAALVAGVAALAPAAGAQQPLAPIDGAPIATEDVDLEWTLAPGAATECVEWSTQPDVDYPGGPFTSPEETDCDLDPDDETYWVSDLPITPVYWHVRTERCAYDDWYDDCASTWGPTAFFDSVEPPPPTKCNKTAASYYGENDLIPHAERKYPSWYETGEYAIDWYVNKPICRDLTGDGDQEMVVQLVCCTGGSLSPWAIYQHDETGQWRRAYAQVRETTWRLTLADRTVRAMTPSPYEGACTRYVRYRAVWWNGKSFKTKRGSRRRIKNPC